MMKVIICVYQFIALIILTGRRNMKKAIIAEQIYPTNFLPMKTFCFEGEDVSLNKTSKKDLKNRMQSARVRTLGIGKSIEVVMKLSEIYQPSTEAFDSIKTGISNSLTLSPQRKLMSAVPTKKPQARPTFMKEQRRSTDGNINFSPLKSNNYKYFPKRQLKLKNNNPYKFYMFSQKSCHQSARFPNQVSKEQHINFESVCTFVKDPTPAKKKYVSVDFRPNRQRIQPWNQRDDPKDDSLIF